MLAESTEDPHQVIDGCAAIGIKSSALSFGHAVQL